MRTPIFVRPLTDAERQALSAGLRSKDTFVVRRCQILLASARGERAPRIAAHLSCDDQTVLEGLHAFNAHGLEALVKRSSRAHHPRRRSLARAPSSCAHCCTAVPATSAIGAVCGRWSWRPRSAGRKG
jgi:hypothetical protein